MVTVDLEGRKGGAMNRVPESGPSNSQVEGGGGDKIVYRPNSP